MTSEQLIRLDQRVVQLEGVIQGLQYRLDAAETKLDNATTKVETLNSFYGGALAETTGRLMALLEKANGIEAKPAQP